MINCLYSRWQRFSVSQLTKTGVIATLRLPFAKISLNERNGDVTPMTSGDGV